MNKPFKDIYMPVRTFARNRVLDVLGAFSRPAAGVHILNAHRSHGEPEPDTFKRLLDRLSEEVEFIRIEDAIRMIEEKRQPDKPLVAFTFDDGFTDCYDYFAPALEEHGVNALFFVNPNYVDGDEAYIHNFNANIVMTPDKRPMRWEQLRELAERGHLIGAHTMNHFLTASDDIEKLRYEIVTCRRIIEDNIGHECPWFAFPYGKLSQTSAEAVNIACETYRYVFSQSDYKHYFSFGGRVINRRHYEPFWPLRHVNYFLSCKKQF